MFEVHTVTQMLNICTAAHETPFVLTTWL